MRSGRRRASAAVTTTAIATSPPAIAVSVRIFLHNPSCCVLVGIDREYGVAGGSGDGWSADLQGGEELVHLGELFRRGAGFGPFVDHESGALDVDNPLWVLLAWDLGPEVRTQSSVPFSPQAELVVFLAQLAPSFARGR